MRFRLSSVEPHGLTEGLLNVMAGSPDVCPHLHVPLQSGSDRVLKAMRRPYDSRWIAGRLSDAALRIPGLCLGLDVICGFPGEGEADHAATMSLLEGLPVAYLHVFPFSGRPGTPAAAMPGQHSHVTKSSRAAALRAFSRARRALHAASLAGRSVEVVDVRAARLPGAVESLTGDYTRVVRRASRGPRRGRFMLRITGGEGPICTGEDLDDR
jgi:threonylcarbamoyladenosine tRNA methylthiotransferase MtaB